MRDSNTYVLIGSVFKALIFAAIILAALASVVCVGYILYLWIVTPLLSPLLVWTVLKLWLATIVSCISVSIISLIILNAV